MQSTRGTDTPGSRQMSIEEIAAEKGLWRKKCLSPASTLRPFPASIHDLTVRLSAHGVNGGQSGRKPLPNWNRGPQASAGDRPVPPPRSISSELLASIKTPPTGVDKCLLLSFFWAVTKRIRTEGISCVVAVGAVHSSKDAHRVA